MVFFQGAENVRNREVLEDHQASGNGRQGAIIELHGAAGYEICPGLPYSAVLSCEDIRQVMSEFSRQ